MGKTWQDVRNAEIDKFEDGPAKPSAPKPKPKERVVTPQLPVYRGQPPEREMPSWGFKAIHDF